MYHILRIILYRLWMLSTFTLLSSIIVFWFYGFFVAFAVFSSGISGILYNAQDLLLYYPNDPPDSRIFVLQPSNYKLPYESIKIRNKDGLKIHMFLIKQIENSKGKPTMIFFHGNAGNMGQRLSNVSGFYHKLNINILMVEYRGYGLSEGSPSERGIYVDAQAAFDYIMQRNDIDRTKVFLFGRSLGGAVAIDLASRLKYKNKIWAVVVENTFTSIPDMAKIILKWRCLLWLPLFCHKNKYMSLSKIVHVVAPTLVMCGSKDALVPPRMARELYLKCGAVGKKIAVMPGGGHDDTWTCRDYYASMQQFLANVPPLPEDVIPYYDNAKDLSITRIVVHTV
ncbi:protein ABHD13 [Aricia agestis]|uniref:protein ABHD13 n=1 Tax=Aricia agestis TaxID=91739 RepID=UPI001C205E92|nr:protein ABHD13 [Aricia agestis]XP_041987687.1 protein ABHD13 [Aricia agestis]